MYVYIENCSFVLYSQPICNPYFYEVYAGFCVVGGTAWEVGEGNNDSVVSHFIEMREKLEGIVDLVRKNEERAKERQKEWYDRHARERELKVVKKALVLLPISTSKLLVEWQELCGDGKEGPGNIRLIWVR